MIRADKSFYYATIAFESGYYLANGQQTVKMTYSNITNSLIEEYEEITKQMAWLSSYSQSVYKYPDKTIHVRIDVNWTLYKNEQYVLGDNIHWTQALVELDGSLPSEISVKSVECADENFVTLSLIEQYKNYSGWFQDSDTIINASINKGVGQAAFAYAELWGVEEPLGHFDGQTLETYNFSHPMWPENNIDGRHSLVTFQNSSGMPSYGLTGIGVSNIMY